MNRAAIRNYFNQKADRWDNTAAERNTGKLENMVKRLGLQPGDTVLDVGTGTGVFLPYIMREVGKAGRAIGIDLSEVMLGRALAKKISGDVSYCCADIEELPVAVPVFDNVVCYSCFPHFANKPAALREIYRVLKPGGRLFICHTSSREHINNVHASMPEMRDSQIPTEDEMREMLQRAGFKDILIDEQVDSYLASAQKSID